MDQVGSMTETGLGYLADMLQAVFGFIAGLPNGVLGFAVAIIFIVYVVKNVLD